MKNTCSQYLFLFLLSLSTIPPLPVEASIDRLRWVSNPRIALPWEAANDYCRSDDGGNGELANARNVLDLLYFSKICGNFYWTCWVGLHIGVDGVWMWGTGHKNALPDTSWYARNPTTENLCGTIHRNKLVNLQCLKTLYFLCENNLVLEEEKTWEEALHHCRALEPDASDLLSFHYEAELSYGQYVMARAQTEEVWIGLRWLAGRWLWMDRTAGGVISLPECPANGTHCGTLSVGGQHARNCMEKRRFFCRKWA